MPFIAGEQGPEVILPATSGTVLTLFRDDARGGWYLEKVLD